jgi:hypothetical protein
MSRNDDHRLPDETESGASSVVRESEGEAATVAGGYLLVGRYERIDATYTITRVDDMTPTAVAAAVQVAQMTYAEPARERTKQCVEETNREKQVTYRILGLGVFSVVVIVFLGLLIASNPSIAGTLVLLGGIMGAIFGGVTLASPLLTTKKKNAPELPNHDTGDSPEK